MAFKRKSKKAQEAEIKKTRLRKLTEQRENIKMALRCARSDADHPAHLIASIEQDEKQIAFLQERVARTKQSLASASSRVEQKTSELAEVNRLIKLEQNEVKIRALKKLSVSISSLGGLDGLEALGLSNEQIEAIKKNFVG